MAPILGIMASQVTGHLWAPSGAYDSIATTTVGAGGASSISFTSIPSTYTHLQIRGIALMTGAQNLLTRFNSDTGSNYSAHELYGSGSAAGAAATTSTNNAYSGYVDSQLGVMVQDILDYSNTSKYKTSRILAGSDANGSGYIFLRSTLWMNTAAITRIDIVPAGAATFTQYSSFALFGIKSA
jgi:hypothetical protein